jgi:hypothetical protein
MRQLRMAKERSRIPRPMSMTEQGLSAPAIIADYVDPVGRVDASVSMPVRLLERLVCALERLAPPSSSSGPSPDGLLTKKQVAARLGKSEREVERMVRRGALRKVPGLGRSARGFARAMWRSFCSRRRSWRWEGGGCEAGSDQ